MRSEIWDESVLGKFISTVALAAFLLGAIPAYAVEIPGSSWHDNNGVERTKIKKEGKQVFAIETDLYFGPQTATVLVTDEVLGPQSVTVIPVEYVLGENDVIFVTGEVLDDGSIARIVFKGTYVLKNGKPKITLDLDAIAMELDEVIVGAEGATVEVQKGKLKAKPKGDTIKIKFLLKWIPTLPNGGFIKITQKYKGVAELVVE